ncbi:hypothetical protein D3C75_1287520 [compost metagenome]
MRAVTLVQAARGLLGVTGAQAPVGGLTQLLGMLAQVVQLGQQRRGGGRQLGDIMHGELQRTGQPSLSRSPAGAKLPAVVSPQPKNQ